VGEQQRRPAHREGVIDLGRGVSVVERRRDESGAQTGEIVDHQLEAVGHQRRDAVARGEAEAQVARGEATARLLEVGPAELPVEGRQRQGVGVPVEARLEQLRYPCGTLERSSFERHAALRRGWVKCQRSGGPRVALPRDRRISAARFLTCCENGLSRGYFLW
jgi:hypothetical protein